MVMNRRTVGMLAMCTVCLCAHAGRSYYAEEALTEDFFIEDSAEDDVSMDELIEEELPAEDMAEADLIEEETQAVDLIEETDMVEEIDVPVDTALLQVGDVISGFTVKEIYSSASIDSVIYTFEHTFSGATLVYVENEDPETAFTIAFRTPYVDETDTNHVFEHAILAGSEKYPSKDIFFDMENKAYQTYVNARTGFTMTYYPVASMSQEQLLKMMDVYMSCMEAPAILNDERYFRREAVRYELYDKEEPISLNGTVYAEDYGFLTDNTDVSYMQLLDALYPEETASNMIGCAHLNFKDLTYENTVATFERCYHYDNSLLFLYGDLDLQRFLAFLDTEYLSKQPVYGTDLHEWEDAVTQPGHVEAEEQIPAYEGDTVTNNSVINYGIDLDGASNVDLVKWQVFAAALNMVGSPLYNMLIEQDVQSPVTAEVETGTAKPFFCFNMTYANPEQKEELKNVITSALTQVSEQGLDPGLMEMILKSQELSTKLLRNNANVGVSMAESFIDQWVMSGDCNYYRVFEQAMAELAADSEQAAFRGMAGTLLAPERSALVTSVPTPGLAEKHDEEVEQYLADMKDAMSEEEVEAMIQETAAFDEWNASELSNNAYQISPDELPDFEEPADFTVREENGVRLYQGSAQVSGVGSFRIYFDLSGMSREEMEYLVLCQNYFGQMDTENHDAAELYMLMGEYLTGLKFETAYPWEAAGEDHRPMLSVSWECLTQNFETSLSLILEMLTGTKFTDAQMLSYLTAVQADYWDMARQDGYDIADNVAHTDAGLRSDTRKFDLDVDGQECYYMMADMVQRLYQEEDYAAELAKTLQSSVDKAFTRDNIIFMSVTGPDEGDAVTQKAAKILAALPQKPEGTDAVYELPVPTKTTAVCIEDSLNTTVMAGDFMKDEGFVGSYIPFVYALNDKYTVPQFRFRLGAYSAGSMHQSLQGNLLTYVFSDPNVKETIDSLKAMPEEMKNMSLTQEELNGYILKAYANATYPGGVLADTMLEMEANLLGADKARLDAITKDIRSAVLDQQAEAAEHFGIVMENASLCTAGNENLIRSAAECFDEIISYRTEE